MPPERVPTDDELVARYVSGDTRAFHLLYDRYAREVERQIVKSLPARVRRRLSVADVLQETYATAFRKLREHDGPRDGAFRQWLHGIAQHKSREALRYHLDTAKRAAGREISRNGRPATHAFRGREPTPSAEAVAAELGEALEEAVGALPDDYRTILRLVHDEGFTVTEAAEGMARSAEAARKLYGRAVSRLSKELESRRGEGGDA